MTNDELKDYELRWHKINPTHSGPYVYCPLGISMFEHFSKGCENFIETGTAGCGGLFHAFKIGFKNYYSVDIDPKFYNDAMYVFEEYDNVSLVQGESHAALEVWLKNINEKCMFWLDAHPNNPNEKTIPNQILFAELEVIKKHSYKEHVILIDDIPVYFSETEDKIKEKILEINPKYQFEIRPSVTGVPDYILCASIAE